ncbi:unnamed protein product [Caenorhabditis auriculariae]|uniref:C-type lectin domain-containing protein n=1 Tax=Caenorhabditis auriculariae TaxID=2777116 RepID=A0A8S1GR55_9PELO|nr:unnamed protein product [Caenorhabditis auriculariae]
MFLKFSLLFLVVSNLVDKSSAACFPLESHIGDKCYRFFQIPKTFKDATQYCHDMGYTIVTICNAIDNNYLASVAGPALSITYGKYWIGYTKSANGTWNWVDTQCNSPGYKNWQSGYPFSTENCATEVTPSGFWRSEQCDSLQFFACQSPPGGIYSTNAPETTTPAPNCKGGTYSQGTGFCYDAWTRSSGISFNDANNEICNKIDNGNLTSIHSAIENDAVISQYPSSANVTWDQMIWIGLRDTNSNFNTASWLDGSSLGYRNFVGMYGVPCGNDCCALISPGNFQNGSLRRGEWTYAPCKSVVTQASCKYRPYYG